MKAFKSELKQRFLWSLKETSHVVQANMVFKNCHFQTQVSAARLLVSTHFD